MTESDPLWHPAPLSPTAPGVPAACPRLSASSSKQEFHRELCSRSRSLAHHPPAGGAQPTPLPGEASTPTPDPSSGLPSRVCALRGDLPAGAQGPERTVSLQKSRAPDMK